ncbi:Pre-mRNA-splicing factor Cwf15/Cwc15 [Lipomyces oligophaga]|uniref:Pre-mRNA-splicing factor Cwf15/Cwc15 n=1 Tax=Lipomyces oligophaga TaxID=45792 RepID=UPI0034CE426E
MTTAHRPTFDPARGKSNQAPTRIYHSRMLPAHTQLKFRKRGQGAAADRSDLQTPLTSEERVWERDAMKRELLEKEAKSGIKSTSSNPQLMIESGLTLSQEVEESEEEDEEAARAKRRKLIFQEVSRNEKESSDEFNHSKVDNESTSGSESSGSEEEEDEEDESDDEDEEDETAELMRELERIKQERAAEKERQLLEEQQAAEADRQAAALGANPLLNLGNNSSSQLSKRWDQDTIFKNQAKGIDDKPKQRFINDMIRSDFHKKFMNKYIK